MVILRESEWDTHREREPRPSPWHWVRMGVEEEENNSERELKLFRPDLKAVRYVPVWPARTPRGEDIICASRPGTSMDAPKWPFCHCLPPPPNIRQEAVSRLRMTLAFLKLFMLPRPWSLWRQWEEASKRRRCSFECVSTLMHVCLVLCCPPISRGRAPPASFSPNSTFHHHWSVPSINGQVCPQSIPISPSRLSSTICLSLFLHFPFFIFHITSLCPPLPPFTRSYLTPEGLGGHSHQGDS